MIPEPSNPRIKVRSGQSFVVDLAHGIATDTFTLGPLGVFRGAGKRELKARARATEEQYASGCKSLASQCPTFLHDFIWTAGLKASPVPIVSTRFVGSHVEVIGEGAEGDIYQRFRSEYWCALAAVSDYALIDDDWHSPAMFLKDDTVVGLLMGVRTP
jgi:hypothetical protein